MSSLAVHGTTLYYELRGQGPAVLFTSGAAGDAGLWTQVAETLADEFTVLTYDRRVNSRSLRPDELSAAPIDQQADDTAELVGALELGPVVGYGSSSGAMILTSLALRHPDVLSGAIFHEPPFAVHSYLPTAEQLARIQLPCLVAAGVENADPAAPCHWLYESARWLADQLDAPRIDTPGAHLPQATHARALAEVLRPFLRTLTVPPGRSLTGRAVARIQPPDRTMLPTDVRVALERGPNLIHFNLLAHASSTFVQRLGYAETLRHRLALPGKVRELAILRVSALVGCRYVEMWHRNLAANAGADASEILAVLRPEFDRAAVGAPEAAALTFVDEMVCCHGAGSAAVVGVLKHFSERELVELGLVVDRYLGMSLLFNSLGVEPEIPAREPVRVE